MSFGDSKVSSYGEGVSIAARKGKFPAAAFFRLLRYTRVKDVVDFTGHDTLSIERCALRLIFWQSTEYYWPLEAMKYEVPEPFRYISILSTLEVHAKIPRRVSFYYLYKEFLESGYAKDK